MLPGKELRINEQNVGKEIGLVNRNLDNQRRIFGFDSFVFSLTYGLGWFNALIKYMDPRLGGEDILWSYKRTSSGMVILSSSTELSPMRSRFTLT